MNYEEVRSILKENKKCIPMIESWYNDEISGSELFNSIVINSPLHLANHGAGFLDFIHQVHSDECFSQEFHLPKRSSGSFYTAWTDLDWFTEDKDLTEEEVEKLVEFGRSFR